MVVEGQLVLLSLVAWNVGNYAFFLLAGRSLGPADYGFVAALLSVVVIASVPCGALQSSTGKALAAEGGGPGGEIYRRTLTAAWRGSLWLLALGGSALVVVAIVWQSLPLAPLAVTLAALAPLPILLTALGALQGTRRFGAFAVGFTLWGLPRPVLLLPFLALGAGVIGSLVATLLCTLLAAGAALVVSRDALAARERALDEELWRSMKVSIRSLAIALAGVAVLINADVIVAKAGLADVDAGRFAAAAVLAKAILIVPQSISFVLLPRIARRHGRGESTARMLLAAVGGTVAAALLVAGLCWIAGEPLVRLTFGGDYVPAAGLLPGFVLVSALVGVNLILVNQQAGTGSTRFGWVLGTLGLLQIGLFTLLHSTATQLILVDGLAAGLGIVAHELLTHRTGGSILGGLKPPRSRVGLPADPSQHARGEEEDLAREHRRRRGRSSPDS